jgi:Ricin-type beta-trefoil lectin domain
MGLGLAFTLGCSGCFVRGSAHAVAHEEPLPPRPAVIPLDGAAAPHTSLAAGAYVLRNVSTGQCLDVPRQSKRPKTPLWEWTCNGTVAQAWMLERSGEDNAVRLRSAASDKCIELPDRRPYVTIWQNDCSKTPEQSFSLIPAGTGTYNLRSRASNHCLDIRPALDVKGAEVDQTPCVDAPEQRWILTLAPGSSPAV